MGSGNAPNRPGRRGPTRPATRTPRPPPHTKADLPTELAATRQELREALDQQTATAEILRAISGSPTDVQPVLDAIARSAAQFCGAEDAFLLLRDGDRVQARAHVGPIPVQIPGSIPLDRTTVPGRVILDGRTIEVGDAKNAADFPLGRELARNSGHNRAFGTPLIRQDAAIGVLLLRRVEDRPFTERERALAETFAAQAVIAIENVRLLNETTEGFERQTAISEVLASIGRSAFDLDTVLATITERAVILARADAATLHRREGDELIVAAFGADAERLLPGVAVGKRQPLGEGSVVGRAVLRGHSVAIADARRDAALSQDGPISRVGIPILRNGEAIGAIGLGRNTGPFSEPEIALVATFADQAAIAIENVRLFNETKEALEQQTATVEILRAISTSTEDVQPVFDAVVERAAKLCEADMATVSLRDGDGFRVVASWNLPAAWLERSKELAPIDRGTAAGRAYMEGQTIHWDDFMTQPDTSEYAKRLQRASGARTTLAVPIKREGTAIGVIVLRRTTVRPFAPRHITLVETFADQAAIAIDNVRLFNETKSALERQTATADVLRLISRSTFDLAPVLDALIETATRLVKAENGIIFVLEGDGYRIAASYGLSAEVRATHRGLVSSAATGTSIAARTGRALEPLQIADVLADPTASPKMLELARADGSRTMLGVPLLRGGVAIGVLSLRRKEVRPFTESEINLVSTYADQAVIAIENVRLFNETKEALERQTATGEVLKAISRSAFDLQRVLDTVIESATKLTNASAGTIWRLEGEAYRVAASSFSIPDKAMNETLRRRAIRPQDQDTVLTRAALSGRPVQVEDVQTDPGYRSSVIRDIGLRTGLAVPLLREGVPIGVLVIGRQQVRPFTEKEIELAANFADQAVIAIENTRLLNEIQDKSQQLAAASRHKSEFMANMSHELRTPLNAIIGFSDVLEQRLFGELNERQADYTRDIASSGRHLLDLVNEILDLSKIEAGRMELAPTEFALADTIHGALAFIRERAASHRIALTADIPTDLGTVVADERKVRQVLLNLLSNAVKFTPDGGTIVVRARSDDAEVQVSVRDTGIGIAPEDQAKVFDEFQQVGKASDRSREGTGLGLTLAKRFVELHGGRIWIESQVGEGTTFTFAIPMKTAAPA